MNFICTGEERERKKVNVIHNNKLNDFGHCLTVCMRT